MIDCVDADQPTVQSTIEFECFPISSDNIYMYNEGEGSLLKHLPGHVLPTSCTVRPVLSGHSK